MPQAICHELMSCLNKEKRNEELELKFFCLRQVHLAENLPQATHTQNRVKTT